MIRLMTCLIRRADLGPEAFRLHWHSDEFKSAVARVAEASRATRYSLTLVLDVAINDDLAHLRPCAQHYDAVIEYFWADSHDLLPMIEGPPTAATAALASAAAHMREIQSRFVEVERSPTFFTEM